jgi:hypothetical protein
MMRKRACANLTIVTAWLVAVAVVPRRADAQVRRGGESHWVVADDPAVDLWFHSLAILGLNGPGTLPFYDSGYVARVADEKARRGIRASALERDGPMLRHVIMTDSGFELLHFLPLYLDRMEAAEVAPFLIAVASPSGSPTEPKDVVSALRASLSSKAEREVIKTLANAIADEWSTSFRGVSPSRTAQVRARRRALQTRWDEQLGPRLAPALRALGDPLVVMLVSPALGPEGRVVSLPGTGVIMAVSDWAQAATPDAPLLAAVRELCFPLLRRVVELDASVGTHGLRSADESSRAAVQCGAQLIDSLVPSAAAEYRALFLAPRAGESADGYRRRFDRRFMTDPALLRATAQAVARVAARSEPSP